MFGSGTYFHAKKADSDSWLRGARAFEWGDEAQIAAQGKLTNPLIVTIPGTSPTADLDAYASHMKRIGILKPGETYGHTAGSLAPKATDVSPQELTRRLQARGYDGVDIRAITKTAGGEGSQIVVFDPKNVRIRPEHKVEKVLRLKRPRK